MGMLSGQIAVVTGAANGIGKACALRLASEGADVAMIDIEADALESAAGAVRQLGVRAFPLVFDLTDRSAVEQAFAQIPARFGTPEILVNNVGRSARERSAAFSGTDFGTLEEIMDVNLYTCMFCTRQVIAGMKTRGRGKIVNIASEAAVTGPTKNWDYAAAKAAIVGFTRSIARELAPHHITVNAVAPGATRTRALQAIPAEILQPTIDAIPLRMICEPEDIANAVAFFASDQSRCITGQTLLVNGGGWLL